MADLEDLADFKIYTPHFAHRGLSIKAALDEHHYETAIKVSDEQLARLRLTPHPFHGDWNYTLSSK